MRDRQKTRFARQLRKAMTRAEALLWSRLRRNALGYRFHRQMPIGPFIVDFGCLESRIAIEVDGATHVTDEEKAYDARRTRYLETDGWRVIRFWNDDIFGSLDVVLDAISRAAWENENALKHTQSPCGSPPSALRATSPALRGQSFQQR